MEKINYIYPIKNNLTRSDEFYSNDKINYNNIYLAIYTINTTSDIPFIQYLFMRDFDLFRLPNVTAISKLYQTELISFYKKYIADILEINSDDGDNVNKMIDYNGYYYYKEDVYLFFDVSKYDIDKFYNSVTNYMFALIDEIINYQHICNIPIEPHISLFFINNSIFCYLYDFTNKHYETPLVGYTSQPTPEKMNFTHVFGECAKTKTDMFGPYFYFTDYFKAIRNGGWSVNYHPEKLAKKTITDTVHGRYTKGGIIRFALFMGKTNYVEIKDINEIANKWADSYDSIYLEYTEIDANKGKNYPSYIIKTYNQQIPLSSHFIDKSKLGEKFDPQNKNYTLL
jgi:hypothetical protein